MSLVAYGGSSESEEEGDTVLSSEGGKKDQDVRKLLSVLPAPNRGKRQPVRLGIPSLNHSGRRGSSDESDSDDDTPPAKRKGRGGGLTSILPRPKQASKIVSKSLAANTPAPMIPYSLSKRPTPQTAARGRRKGVASKTARAGEDSDSDGEPTSFFSLLENTSEPTATPALDPAAVGTAPLDPAPSSSTHWGSNYGSSDVVYNTAPSAPKPFSLTEDSAVSYDLPEPELLGEWEQEEEGQSSNTKEPDPVGPVLGAGPGLSMDEQAYRRLVGGRRKRGRDPSLNDLIEIKEDDVKVEIENYRKHNSDETVDKLYKPPEGAKPTGQQKRKHQLTYLAHEAKANELKLLKQWGQSSATRRDTQMKYGF